jgi:aryl-alcohol dehydrogenase-like predicted oxidoreductase
MQKRRLGRTGLDLTLIGFGGFHLVEVPKKEASYLLNSYLDSGGNYIETAALYGDGISEKKIGEGVSSRRDEFILATKTLERTKKGAMKSLERSLKYLKTDYVDILFMHEMQTLEDSKSVLAKGGAVEAAEEAVKTGKARFTGVTGHGRPQGLLYSVEHHTYDVLMTGFNYYDRFNFPQIEDVLLPLCIKKGIGVLGMKALADGYLFRSAETAIRYTLSLPISSLVLGINSREYLKNDMEIVRRFSPLAEEERETLFRSAPELGRYVCRLCGKCKDEDGLKPWDIFLIEGLYDRQMTSDSVPDPAQYAMQERLKHWFKQAHWAREEYERLDRKVDPRKDYSSLNGLCPYGIDIDQKLKIAHSKLSDEGYIY